MILEGFGNVWNLKGFGNMLDGFERFWWGLGKVWMILTGFVNV